MVISINRKKVSPDMILLSAAALYDNDNVVTDDEGNFIGFRQTTTI